MSKLSIIIPVYNSEKYLEKCLDSVLNQTLTDLEIIIVNDGSTDNSTKIIDNYQKKDSRIKLFTKKNGGQGSARNYGLKEAKGDYIAFLDSDDYVKTDMYQTLYKKAIKDNYDIVICNYYLVYKNKIEKNKSKITDEKRILTPQEYLIQSPCPWNRIIKRSFLIENNFNFPEGIIYEDLAAIPTLSIYNPKILFINEYLHYYVQSDNSTLRNKEYKAKYEDIFPAIEYLYNHMINKGFDYELEYLITYHFLYLSALNFYEFKKYKNLNKISHIMKTYYPKWFYNKLTKENFTKKELLYMKLFYYKKYFFINIYRRIINK